MEFRLPDTDITLDSLRAMARLAGLDIGDERLEVLLPQIQRSAASMDELDEALDLEGVEPAVTFGSGQAAES